MPKKTDENYREYRDRVIDPVSPSFCAAKWLNSTIWLNSGSTTSCHHPPAHNIIDSAAGETIDMLKDNPSMIHNTTYKKSVRKQMLDGIRPPECEYCWKIEDIGPQQVSDRVFKTVIYTDEEVNECATDFKETADVDLKTLEIAFDSNCNFACSYCNSSFSTTWQKDLRQNGPYQHLVSDGAKAFQQNGDWTKKFKKNEANPYVDAFWDWWPQLSQSLQELRITGGEATMSPEFWKLVEWWKSNPDSEIQFAVNSNLGVKDSMLNQLIDATKHIKKFVMYSSCESVGPKAEYIRDGLVWEDWKIAVERLINEGDIKELHMMMTINSLSLYSLTEFIDYCNDLKLKYGWHIGVVSANILRFPSFMSCGTLPKEMREERANHIEDWINNKANRKVMHQMETDGLFRLIEYLREVDVPHRGTSSIQSRQRDFKSFYQQYDKRRGLNFVKAFPELEEWYNSLSAAETIPITQMFDGDSTKGWGRNKAASEEGWIANPKDANPTSKDYEDNA